MKVHELKCWPPYFGDVLSGVKTFEYRKDDRHFSPGDILLLKEWLPQTEKYTGREVSVDVVYTVLGGQFGIPKGYCILGIRPYPRRATGGVEPNAPQQAKVVTPRKYGGWHWCEYCRRMVANTPPHVCVESATTIG